MTIAEACRRVDRAINGIENEIINDIIPAVESDIVNMQTMRLFEGKNADGTDITPEYSFQTLDYKLRHNQPTDRVTLKDTGAFYSQIFAKAYDSEEILIDSNDDKSDDLKEKYGESIFGLTKENKSEIKEETTTLLVDYLKEITGFE